MFWKHLSAALLVAVILLASATQAEARRGRGIPIPIPGLRGETLIKVLELPRIAMLKRSDGQYVDLGYKFYSWSGGDWIGYIGSESEYLPMTPEKLQVLMVVAGLKELPPIPDRPWGFSEWLWIGIGGLVLSGVLFKKLAGSSSSKDVPREVERMASMSRADAAIDAALKSRSALVARAVTPPAGPRSPVRGQQLASGAPRAAFGRRG